MCDRAYDNYRKFRAEPDDSTDQNFDQAFQSLKREMNESENDELVVKMKRDGKLYYITKVGTYSIEFRKQGGGTEHTLSIQTLRELYHKERDYPRGLGSYYSPLVDKLKKYGGVFGDEILDEEKNYVLIIDEINRGNISQILGELITLIETDKRMGEKEALQVVLPYSKTPFAVPPNLFIVGTMNTADRSVEALDTALRRRFSFAEMKPRPELLNPARMIFNLWWEFPEVSWKDEPYLSREKQLFDFLGVPDEFHLVKIQLWEDMKAKRSEGDIELLGSIKYTGINLEEILQTINTRLEKLLSKDHVVGHAYFMDINSLDKLRIAFESKLIPLLLEFFYGDMAKVGLVIGSGFFENPSEAVKSVVFASFPYDDLEQLQERAAWNRRNVLQMKDEETLRAIDLLLART